MVAVGFSLIVMLAEPGHRGTWMAMSDYDTADECEIARERTLEYWHTTRGPDYRVRFEAECIIISGPE